MSVKRPSNKSKAIRDICHVRCHFIKHGQVHELAHNNIQDRSQYLTLPENKISNSTIF